jgi:hypothetical protein
MHSTVELGDGHYFVNDPGLIVNVPVKIVGDENEPSHVILEMSGEIVWKPVGGWMEGVTVRRPRIATGVTPSNQILRIDGGRVNMYNCVFDNRGSVGNCISVSGNKAGGNWEKAVIRGGSHNESGLFVENGARVELIGVSELQVCQCSPEFNYMSLHYIPFSFCHRAMFPTT